MARFFYDLAGAEPIVKDLYFNNDVAAVGDAKAYDGSFVKLQDYDDIDHGRIIHSMDGATIYENQIGIICEEVAASGETYLLDTAAATGTAQRKKILVNPFAVYLCEYVRKDRAGTDNTDTGFAFSAAGTVSTTSPDSNTDDDAIGSWIYFIDGANAGYLHNILDSADSSTAGVAVLRTAVSNVVVAANTVLLVEPPFAYEFDLNATITDFKSEWVPASKADRLKGIDHWISAPGVPFQKLNTSKHDGLKIDGARFYHEVALANAYFPGPLAAAGMLVS
jgi:hypothetical protein